MKTLILTCKTGQGHNSAANALQQAINKKDDAFCYTKDILSFMGKKAPDVVGNIYSDMVIKKPAFFGALYKAGDFVSSFKFLSPIFFANAIYSQNLARFIKQYHFDTIICTHIFAMEAMTCVKLRYKLNIKCYGVFTDYTFHPFMNETKMDAFFIPHKSIIKVCIKTGISPKLLHVTGIPVAEKFKQKLNKNEIQTELQIPLNNDVFLIMCGGMGAGNVLETCCELLKSTSKNVLIIIMNGKN